MSRQGRGGEGGLLCMLAALTLTPDGMKRIDLTAAPRIKDGRCRNGHLKEDF